MPKAEGGEWEGANLGGGVAARARPVRVHAERDEPEHRDVEVDVPARARAAPLVLRAPVSLNLVESRRPTSGARAPCNAPNV
jgi:hypothetical protein